MNYQIYLMHADHIRAAESFSASGDVEAREMAALLYDACSDAFECCELWLKAERLAQLRAQSGASLTSLAEAVRDRQENLLDLEDHLQRTFSCIRASKKLLDTTAELRDRLRDVPTSSSDSVT